MPQNKQVLKRRIRSIKATKKITSAMEMIAISKLQKQKNMMEANRLYSHTLHRTINQVLSKVEMDELTFFKPQKGVNVNLVFVSDMGLCGAYNTNILSYIKDHLSEFDKYILVGSKIKSILTKLEYDLIAELDHSDNVEFTELANLGNIVIRMFQDKQASSFNVLYTKYVNSMSFEPTVIQLLPIQFKVEKEELESGPMIDLILEPDPSTLVNQLIPMYIHSLLYSLALEAKTSEQAARRLAMDNATDNAQEIIEELILKFNQSRQASITQEITEIIAGAEAL